MYQFIYIHVIGVQKLQYTSHLKSSLYTQQSIHGIILKLEHIHLISVPFPKAGKRWHYVFIHRVYIFVCVQKCVVQGL